MGFFVRAEACSNTARLLPAHALLLASYHCTAHVRSWTPGSGAILTRPTTRPSTTKSTRKAFVSCACCCAVQPGMRPKQVAHECPQRHPPTTAFMRHAACTPRLLQLHRRRPLLLLADQQLAAHTLQPAASESCTRLVGLRPPRHDAMHTIPGLGRAAVVLTNQAVRCNTRLLRLALLIRGGGWAALGHCLGRTRVAE